MYLIKKKYGSSLPVIMALLLPPIPVFKDRHLTFAAADDATDIFLMREDNQ